MEPALGSDVLPAANLKGQRPIISPSTPDTEWKDYLYKSLPSVFLNSKLVDKLSNLKLDVFVTTWG